MNAVFLLLTSAAMAGHEGHAAPAPLAAPVAGCANGSCGAVGSCCDPCCDKPGLFARLRARFHKNDCCDTCTPVVTTCCKPAPACGCDNGCGKPGFFARFHKCNDCAPSCGSCGSSCDSCCDKPSLLDRIRARFHKCNDCCDSCNTCGNGAVAAPAAPAAEKKKMEAEDEADEEAIEDAPKSGAKKLPAGNKTGRVVPVEPPSYQVTPAASKVGARNPF